MSEGKHGPVTPSGLNHLVINVRNIEETHRFWTEKLGFIQVGTFDRPDPRGPRQMRFYIGKGAIDRSASFIRT